MLQGRILVEPCASAALLQALRLALGQAGSTRRRSRAAAFTQPPAPLAQAQLETACRGPATAAAAPAAAALQLVESRLLAAAAALALS